MAREAIRENFCNENYVEGKHDNVVLFPRAKRIRRRRKPSNLYGAYVELLDSLGMTPEDISVKKALQCVMWTCFAWLMVVLLAV